MGILKTAAAAESTESLADLIGQFQRTVWNADRVTGASETQEEILRELAYDLEFFVANERNRQQDPSYFGPERAKAVISIGLRALSGSDV